MKLRLLTALLAFALIAQAAAPENQAQAKAEAWLALVDSAQYSQSWTQASAFFRAHVDEPKWTQMVGAAVGPMGAKKSRTFKSIVLMKTMPGAPDGNYAVLRFDATFANKAAAVETITMMDEGGEWRMAGYFIR